MTFPNWRMFEPQTFSGAMNMALDEVLLQAVQAGTSPPVVRLYRWQPATVTLGYAQRGNRQVNVDYCREHNIDIVRRLTGGRAVLHDEEVTYSVISRQQGIFSADPLESYQTIASVLLDCLQNLGLDAQSSGRHAGQSGAGAVEQSACFTAPAQFEVVCKGKKTCGSSQKRTQGSFLQHGSIPVDMDLEKLFCSLNTDPDASLSQGVERLQEKVGWINRFSRKAYTVAEVEAQLLTSFEALWPVRFQKGTATEEEMHLAQQLAESKYADIDWPMR